MPGNADGMAQLQAALQDDLPDGLEDADDATLVTLAAAVREAEERQLQALLDASDQALRYVPALLRGAVRKAIFG